MFIECTAPDGAAGATSSIIASTLRSVHRTGKIVKAVWTAAGSLWDVVAHDEGAGFEVDLEEL